MNLQNIVAHFRAKAAPNERASIDQIASLPEVQAALEREDIALQAERKAIVDSIARVPAKYANKLAENAKACEAAVAAQEAAERAVIAARDDLNHKRALLNGLSGAEANELGELRQQLLETADSRLADLIGHLDDLSQMTRHVGWSEPQAGGRDIAGRRIYKDPITNWPQVRHAREELDRVRAEAIGLQYAAIGRVDLTEKLQSMLLELDAALTPLEMAILRMDEAGNIVKSKDYSRSELVDNALRKVGAPADAMAQAPTKKGAASARAIKAPVRTMHVNDEPGDLISATASGIGGGHTDDRPMLVEFTPGGARKIIMQHIPLVD